MADAPPPTRQIPLTDGSMIDIPAGTPAEAEPGLRQRAEAALGSNQSQSSGPDQGGGWLNAVKTTAQNVNNYLSGVPAAAVQGPANLGIDAATILHDAPASVENALIHTAKNYGAVRPDFPEATLWGPAVKSAAGVTPFQPGSLPAHVENALLIAGTSGADMVPAIMKGLTGETLQTAGTKAGGMVADATDPRLSPLLQVIGGALPFAPGLENLGSGAARATGLRGANAGPVYDAAVALAQRLGLKNPPLSAGAVGSSPVRVVEKMLGAIPGANVFTEGARQNSLAAIEAGIHAAASDVGPPGFQPRSEPGGPGALFTEEAQNDLTNRWNAAKSATNNIEGQLANQTTPTGEMKLVPLSPILNSLEAQRTKQFGPRTYNTAGSDQNNAIDTIKNNISARAVPEDLNLDRSLAARISANTQAIQSGKLPPASQAAAIAQITRDTTARAANMGVPFEALRAEKSNVGTRLEGDASLDYRTDKGLYDTLTSHVQDFANSSGMGPAYQNATDLYSNAMDVRNALKNSPVKPAGYPVSPGRFENPPGRTDLTGDLMRSLKNPETVQNFATAPYWTRIGSSALDRLGLRTTGAGAEEFDPRTMATQWETGTDQGKAQMTSGAPRSTFDNAATVARAVNGIPSSQTLTHSLTGAGVAAALAEHAFNNGLWHFAPALAGATVGGAALESPASIRMLAGRPNPVGLQVRQNLPALLAVANATAQRQAQQGNQGQ